jgi:hypothetical protein
MKHFENSRKVSLFINNDLKLIKYEVIINKV